MEEAEDGRSGEVPRRRLTPRRADEQPQARLVAARELVRVSGVPGCCLDLEHLECSRQPHTQGRGAEKRTQRAG